MGEIFRYVVQAPAGMPENEVRALQDWVLRPALRAVPGVADVVSFGAAPSRNTQVQADPLLLNRYGVTLDQVRQALSKRQRPTPAAAWSGAATRRWSVRGIGIFEHIEDIGRARGQRQQRPHRCWCRTSAR